MDRPNIFAVDPADGEPVLAAVERGLAAGPAPAETLPALSSVVLGDPYLAAQLVALRQHYELRPPHAQSLLARLRTRLAWWLLGPELRQMTEVNATLVRILDSLIAKIDEDKARIQIIGEQQTYGARAARACARAGLKIED